EVRIATNGARNSVTARWQSSRPSLVFSPYSMREYRPKRGTVYASRGFSKLDQIERLSRQGLPVPRTAKLTRDLTFDTAVWGRYVVAKPLRGAMGRDVYLVRTSEVAGRYELLTLNDTREMIVQPYVEHSEDGYPTEYRVLTLFGKVLYSARNCWGEPRRSLEEIACDPRGIIASNDKHFGRVRTVCNDPEIIALGEQTHAAFPECPTLGVDLLRGSRYRKDIRDGSKSGRRHLAPFVIADQKLLHARTYARSVHAIRCARSHCTAPHQKDPAGGQLIPTVLRLSELAGALRFIKPRQEV